MQDDAAPHVCKWCYQPIQTQRANYMPIATLAAWAHDYCSVLHQEYAIKRAYENTSLWWQVDLGASSK